MSPWPATPRPAAARTAPTLSRVRRLGRWLGALVTLAVLVSALPWELSVGTPAPRAHRGVAAEHGEHRRAGHPSRHGHEGHQGDSRDHAPCGDGCLCPLGGGLAMTPPPPLRGPDVAAPPSLGRHATAPRVLHSLDVLRRIDHPPRLS